MYGPRGDAGVARARPSLPALGWQPTVVCLDPRRARTALARRRRASCRRASNSCACRRRQEWLIVRAAFRLVPGASRYPDPARAGCAGATRRGRAAASREQRAALDHVRAAVVGSSGRLARASGDRPSLGRPFQRSVGRQPVCHGASARDLAADGGGRHPRSDGRGLRDRGDGRSRDGEVSRGVAEQGRGRAARLQGRASGTPLIAQRLVAGRCGWFYTGRFYRGRAHADRAAARAGAS